MNTPQQAVTEAEPAPRDADADAAAYVRALQAGDDGLAAFYAAQADRADQARDERLARPDAVLSAALYYAGHGLRVFPLSAGRKTPLPGSLGCCGGSHRRGCLDALADLGAVYAWWAEHPDANVGIATGTLVDVWDQDGPAGAVSWTQRASDADLAAVIGVATTARGVGGVHRYIRATGRGNGAGVLPGLDYRGAGGYVVAPPSVVNGRRYAWTLPLAVELARAA